MLRTLNALINAYKNYDLTDDEVVSLWNCYITDCDESLSAFTTTSFKGLELTGIYVEAL